ncbi:actin-binding Rho-activating protein [Apteryx mantelli]|uniref:Actin-binding Rho-activating protein n=1 Tax=Apteryx mantelli TaxID=2696672 RepID=A0A8B7JGD3_9AVES|nr:PREDICTED: actin-binding Rho-activating protein [Apteryx mantelli mantelli]XP_025935795.1 actin-binding Rho-activating protein [Apteryx rowi]
MAADSNTAPEEKPSTTPAKRAVRKIRTASLVISLARGWQQWASDHNIKQAQEPSGWVPSREDSSAQPLQERPFEKWPMPSVKKHQMKDDEKSSKESVTIRDVEKNSRESDEALKKLNIKSKEVTKTIVSKAYERGGDISLLSDRYENDNSSSEMIKLKEESSTIDKILSGKLSPTMRRKCSNLVSELTKGWKVMEQEDKVPRQELLLKCHDDSMDTVDSGYGEAEDRLELEDGDQEKVAAVRIKRPVPSLTSKFTEEITKKAHRKYSPVNSLKDKWQEWADEHIITQKLNPFSEEFDHELAMSTRLHKGDEGYGHPKEGTKTAERAKRAEAHIHREIRDMGFIIKTMAKPRHDGKIQVTFGELFERYVRISDKVVGILMRARKHGLVDFEGEMLWQGRDDHIIITLLE